MVGLRVSAFRTELCLTLFTPSILKAESSPPHSSAWGGFFATLHWCLGIDTSTFNDLSEGRRYIKFLQFWSLVLILASITPLRYKPAGYGGAGFAIAAGALTLIACMYVISLYDELSREVMRMTMMLLFLLWACVAGVCTFYGPFLVPSKWFTAVSRFLCVSFA